MELTAAHAMQFLMLVGTIAGGYAVVKSQLARVIEDLENHITASDNHKTKFDARLDDAESQRAVFASQIKTLSQINSVASLAELNTRLARLEMGHEYLSKQIDRMHSMHNGKHPPVDN
jgi:uncharacterized coiled-coil protein SlyX|tara:strand:- start:4790 stop:5143 length:354 start_codon:yes stop_codon:yes gene_type:complete